MRAPFSKILSVGLLLGICAFYVSSCSHYHWGSPAQFAPFRSVYVKPIVNKAYAPQAQALLSNQLIQSLQQATLKTYSCAEAADATLEVTLIDYKRQIAGTQSADTLLANSFEVVLVAEVTLIDNNTNKALIKKRLVEATITALTDEGLQAIEYQDMPTLTRKLSTKIKDLVISAW